MPPVEPNNASGLQRTAPTALPVAVLVSATLLAYANSFSGPFVFDDIATIVDSPSIRTLSPVWPVLFQGGVSSVGRPLVNLSLALNYAWGGMDVTSWHVVNLTLHIVAGITLFGVIRRTLEQSPVAASLKEHGTVIAMFCSLIWLLHPLQTESVTYIVQRAESLAGLFYFLTLYFAIRSASSERSGLWGTAAFLACLCGVGSKEVIVSAPLAVIVYDWALFGRTIRSVSHRRRWLYAALFSTWIPLIFLVAQGRHESAGFGYGLGAWDYAMTQFGAITRYLYLCFWPNSLVLDYGASVTRNASEIIPGAIIVGMLAGGSVAAIRYQPWVAFLGFFFFAVLSPSSSFIPLVTQTVAEHRMYLPLASVVVIAVLIVWHMCRAILRKLYPVPSETGSVIACVVLALIAIYSGYLTKERNAEYKDPIRLWTSNIERCTESLRPYIQIGALYLEQDPRTAIYLFDRAIEGYQQTQERNGVTQTVEGHLASVYSGRGAARLKLGDFESAVADFDRSMDLDPTGRSDQSIRTLTYRGMALVGMGREDDALKDITRAIEFETAPEQLYIRAEIFSRKARYSDAIQDLARAIQMDVSNPYYYQSRGSCLMKLGRQEDAVDDFSMAIRLQPDFVTALQSRGEAYAKADRHAEAIDDFSRVITLSPGFADAYSSRAKSLLRVGEIESARTDMEAFETQFGESDPELRRLLNEMSTESSSRNRP